jgi:hypothetical protein
VSSGIVVGSIFLSVEQLVRIKELSVSSISDRINDSWLEVNKDGSGDVLSKSSLREESVEGIGFLARSGVRGHHSIWLNSMLQAIELPARVTKLHSSLSNVNRKNFSHGL